MTAPWEWAVELATNRAHHSQAENITRPSEDEQWNCQPTEHITHKLRLSQGHKRISTGSDKQQSTSLTGWEHHKAIRWSAVELATNRAYHSQAENITWPSDDQQWNWQPTEHITHKLRTSHSHWRISSGLGNQQSTSLTCWDHHKAIGGSAVDLATNRAHHSHAENITRPSEDQQSNWQPTEHITHMLRTSQAQQRISIGIDNQQCTSLTCWEHHKAISGSSVELASNRAHHSHAENITRPSDGQQWNLQPTEHLTHFLRTSPGHQRISSRICNQHSSFLTN